MRRFLSAAQFAAHVGIGNRAAQLALQASEKGHLWRGAALVIRKVPGRGGTAGLVYEVAEDSIPLSFMVASEASIKAPSETSEKPVAPMDLPIQAASSEPALALAAPAVPFSYPRARVTGDSRQCAWRYDIIRPVVEATPPNSTERAELIAKIAATAARDWRGEVVTVSAITLRRWIARYETRGYEGLWRKARHDAGDRRVLISRQLDAALCRQGLSESQIGEIAATLRHRVRSEWRSGTPSWPTVQLNTLPTAIRAAREAGLDLPDHELRALCSLPRPFIEAERRYAVVATDERDAACFAARFIPRIKRDRSHLRPMDWVAADVHHMDILVQRPDGSVCTPKMVAWLDLATNRAWADIFIMPKGQMIRTEHVVQSFVHFAGHPNWGAPTKVYGDNGGEYNWMDLTSDLNKLKQPIDVFGTQIRQANQNAVQRARPYNPQAKVIETFFSTLERVAISQLPGYIGGNRMRKKTANQGREPEPYSGDETQFRAAIETAVAYYNAKPQEGYLNGQSPNERFSQFVANGWRSTILDPWELSVAFSKEFVKQVHTGGTLKLSGAEYRADALQSLVGQRVLVRQPIFGDRETLFVFTEHGEPIAVARPDRLYAFGDPRGAGEQSRRQAALKSDVRALRSGTASLDGQETMADVVGMFGPSAQAETDGVIRLNPEFSEAARMARNAPAASEGDTFRKQSRRAEASEFRKRLLDAMQAERMAG